MARPPAAASDGSGARRGHGLRRGHRCGGRERLGGGSGLVARRLGGAPLLLVGDPGVARHHPPDLLAVRRLEPEELREVAGRGEGEGPAGGLARDQPEAFERLRVLVHLRPDHVEQVALEDRLVVRDEGRRLEEVSVDLRRGEGPGPLRVVRADLHRPFGPDRGDLDGAPPCGVLPREGAEVSLDDLDIEPGRPREVFGRQGLPRREQRRLDDRALAHGWTAGGPASAFGARSGSASNSSIVRSVSAERRFTKISPYGYSFCHSFTFSRWARNRRDMKMVTSSQMPPAVNWRSGTGSPSNWTSRPHVRALSSVRSSGGGGIVSRRTLSPCIFRIDHARKTSFPAVTKFTAPSFRTLSMKSFVKGTRLISHGSSCFSSASSNAATTLFSNGSRTATCCPWSISLSMAR